MQTGVDLRKQDYYLQVGTHDEHVTTCILRRIFHNILN